MDGMAVISDGFISESAGGVTIVGINVDVEIEDDIEVEVTVG